MPALSTTPQRFLLEVPYRLVGSFQPGLTGLKKLNGILHFFVKGKIKTPGLKKSHETIDGQAEGLFCYCRQKKWDATPLDSSPANRVESGTIFSFELIKKS